MALLDVTDGWYRVMSLDDLVDRGGWRVSRLDRYGGLAVSRILYVMERIL
jgi:hypothetical protein